ncbi:unnamed protein product [Vicia faba]|uniref:Importin-7/11-like TPR repeats domain-containing protein n=1 Tax=Vicia faba TaxID=3906 RepID=A0AAV0YI40_VICFA|nr:unnamed protein product [Vicia faba]
MWPLLSGGKPVMVVVHDAPIKELTQRTAFICTSHRTLRLKVIHELNQLVEGESLLQIQLLVSLRNIVIALGYQSPIFHNITLPLLENEIDINSPNELSLLEDNMLFWEATLSQAPPMLLWFIILFTPCVVERNFDHLQVVVNIIEYYIILGGNDF